MIPKIVYINFLLIICLCIVSGKIIGLWSQNTKDLVSYDKPSEKQEYSYQQYTFKENGKRLNDYASVSEKNIFHPQRVDVPVNDTPVVEEPKVEPEPEPEPVIVEEPDPEVKDIIVEGTKLTLFGVIKSEKYSAALLTNPFRGEALSTQFWLEQGKTVGDYRLERVKSDRIILANGPEKYTVLLFDKKEVARGVQKSGVAPTVVKTEPVNNRPKNNNVPGRNDSPAQKADDDQYKTVNTPFGKVKYRKY